MGKIVSPKNIKNIVSKIKRENKSISLCGGCFDILHPGHLHLLNYAKAQTDYLFVLLENDLNIKKRKGDTRPIFDQKQRAQVLSFLNMVDVVVLLPKKMEDQDYDDLVMKISPDVIVTTQNDSFIQHKIRQAKKVSASLQKAPFLPEFSTSKIVNLIKNKLT